MKTVICSLLFCALIPSGAHASGLNDAASPPAMGGSGAVNNNAATTGLPHTHDIHGIIMQAIDSTGSVKKYVLDGKTADNLRMQTQAPPRTPVYVTVSTLKVFRPGCNRMRLQFTEPTHLMATTRGTEEPFSVYYDFNICRDGRPPQLSHVGVSQ